VDLRALRVGKERRRRLAEFKDIVSGLIKAAGGPWKPEEFPKSFLLTSSMI